MIPTAEAGQDSVAVGPGRGQSEPARLGNASQIARRDSRVLSRVIGFSEYPEYAAALSLGRAARAALRKERIKPRLSGRCVRDASAPFSFARGPIAGPGARFPAAGLTSAGADFSQLDPGCRDSAETFSNFRRGGGEIGRLSAE